MRRVLISLVTVLLAASVTHVQAKPTPQPTVDRALAACLAMECPTRPDGTVFDCHALCAPGLELQRMRTKYEQTDRQGRATGTYPCRRGPHDLAILCDTKAECAAPVPEWFAQGGVLVWERNAKEGNTFRRGGLGPPVDGYHQLWTDWPFCGGKPAGPERR